MTERMTPSRDIARLIEIMAALRTPNTGCPWDLEQTFATIAPYTIEEAYEVADAIARDDRDELRDELGDLLLQVVYHARMAEEEGSFTFGDVVQSVSAKMIRRHPHVFGDATASSASDVDGLWDRIKAEEKAAKHNPPTTASLLDDVPIGLPALTRAIKLQNKAAKVGFDWPDLQPVLGKLREELAEFEHALNAADRDGDGKPQATQDLHEEFGDVLFVMANIARHLGINAEDALRGANRKFSRRFAYIEQKLAARGITPADSDLAEMDALWNEIRATEKADKS